MVEEKKTSQEDVLDVFRETVVQFPRGVDGVEISVSEKLCKKVVRVRRKLLDGCSKIFRRDDDGCPG